MPGWIWDLLISTIWYVMGRVDQHYGITPPFTWYHHAEVLEPGTAPTAPLTTPTNSPENKG